MSKVYCQQCRGLGYTTTQEPKAIGRCSNGEMVHSSRTVPVNRRCEACKGTGKSEAEPIVFGGHTIHAPGFTSEQFERGIARALTDDLRLERQGDVWFVYHPHGWGYAMTRERCACPAGQHGQPCKHRAMLCFRLDVREPARRREWQQAERATMRKVAA